jgi:hypothetical protein
VLLTKENLFKRKITSDPLCPICSLEVEIVGHALWSCSAARDFWAEINGKIQKSTSDEDEFSFILLRMLNKLEGPNFDIFTCIAWQIWFRRNKLVFEGFFTHSKKVAQIAKEQLDFYIQVAQWKNEGRRSSSSQTVDKWTTPNKGIVKINWAAALDKQKKLMGVGVVVHNHTDGTMAIQCCTWSYINDPAVTKAMVLKTTITLRQHLGLMNIIFEGDSLEVVQAVRKEEKS